ncbi:ribonuclease BN [Nibricoccus aquaticus]|uniref:Ribonuclease BN n=1 Tax=Nibricoccus aquaticus TaxID=2576891 RepID=A0A290QMV7_9BACT|nr:YihY/virulence factor BrkB family protein [Nibricoccus aquaticus]ATC66011.1 ribonuclease BN [Nibricoccus aquaticus]
MPMQRWDRILFRAGKSWFDDDVFKHSAAVSFYTLFSLAPITIIAVWVAGFFFGQEAASGQLSDQISQLVGKEGSKVIEDAVAASRPENTSWFSMAAGFVVLLIGATTVFGQLQESLNEIWGVMTKPNRNGFVVLLVRRLISFAMVLTVGFLLLVSLVLTTAISSLVKFADSYMAVSPIVLQGVDLVVALGVITVLFALVFKFLPDVHLRWRDVWQGAFVTALLFSVGRLGISFYLSHSTVASTYGAAGSLVALLIWIYYSCAILFFGAEVTRAARENSGLNVQPKSKAVRVTRQIVEEVKKNGPVTGGIVTKKRGERG